MKHRLAFLMILLSFLSRPSSATMAVDRGDTNSNFSEVGDNDSSSIVSSESAVQQQRSSYSYEIRKRAQQGTRSLSAPLVVTVIPLEEWRKIDESKLSYSPGQKLNADADQEINAMAFERELERVSGQLKEDDQLASLRGARVSGVTRRGRQSRVLTCQGDATYYHPTGKRTASGDRYTGSELSGAAISRFPLNSVLVVCRQDQSHICVKIKANDRGGFERKRGNPTLVDLSPAAARYLGFGPRSNERDDGGNVIGRMKISIRGPGC